jgi:hypothetical protein
MIQWKKRAAFAAVVALSLHASAGAGGGGAGGGGASGVTTFSNTASFNAAIAGAAAPSGGGILVEDFSAIEPGFAGTLGFGTFNGLGFVAGTIKSGGGLGNLLNPAGALGTTGPGSPLFFELTQIGAPLYGFGGNIWLRNEFGAILSGSIAVQVGRVGGTVDSFVLTTSGPTDYFGVVSTTPLSFVSFTPTSPVGAFGGLGGLGTGAGSPGAFVTADNVTIAGLIPTPSAAGALALSGLIFARRRRSA